MQDLTLKQSKFLDIYFKTGNATEAAMQVYECKDRMSARNVGSENLAKLGITIADMMNSAGLTDKYLVERLKALMEMKKTVKSLDKDGNLIEEQTDDINAIVKGLDIAFRIKGKYVALQRAVPFEKCTDRTSLPPLLFN